MPNQTGSNSKLFYDLLKILLKKIGVDEESEKYKQLVAEEDMLWVNATNNELWKYAKKAAAMTKSTQRIHFISARNRRDKARKTVAN